MEMDEDNLGWAENWRMLICKNVGPRDEAPAAMVQSKDHKAAGDTTEWQIKVGAARSHNTAMLACTMSAAIVDKCIAHCAKELCITQAGLKPQ